MPDSNLQQSEEEAPLPSPTRRWIIVALLFVIALLNYFDRQSLSIVAPRLQAELGMNDQVYGHIVSIFLFASTIAFLICGWISDKLGTRSSMTIFVGVWSIAEAATTFVTNAFGLGMARLFLGLGEPGLWVAAPKAVGEMLPRRQRGLAIGIYTLGATVGAVIVLPAIGAISTHFPYRWIFLFSGIAGIVWLPLWLVFSKNKNQLQTHIAKEQTPYLTLLRAPAVWRLLVARGLTDHVWFFYLYWFPKYLMGPRNINAQTVASHAWVVYLFGGLGALLGPLFSSLLARRQMPIKHAYRAVMLAAACIMPLNFFCGSSSTFAAALAIASIIGFAHMAWLIALTATAVESFRNADLGRASGLIAAGSALGGTISSELIGYAVMHSGYHPVFLAMTFMHLLAIMVMWRVFRTPKESAVTA